LAAVACIIGAAIDRAAAEARLRHRALHDELTELPNRALLRDRLAMQLAELRRSDRHVGVVHVNVDRFALVNESFGQVRGDAVLVELADRLQNAAAGETVGRFGGDEFVAFATIEDPRDAACLAQRLLAAFVAPFAVPDVNGEVFLSASLGIAVSDQSTDADGLLRDAAIAQGRAAQHGGNRYELFDQRLRRSAIARLTLERDIRRALAGAIVNLGHALGLHVVGEGVETNAQLDILRELGCERAQGWLFSHAVPAEELDAWWLAPAVP